MEKPPRTKLYFQGIRSKYKEGLTLKRLCRTFRQMAQSDSPCKKPCVWGSRALQQPLRISLYFLNSHYHTGHRVSEAHPLSSYLSSAHHTKGETYPTLDLSCKPLGTPWAAIYNCCLVVWAKWLCCSFTVFIFFKDCQNSFLDKTFAVCERQAEEMR